jgi:DNA-binding LacI/PurR family transcriptional regulator
VAEGCSFQGGGPAVLASQTTGQTEESGTPGTLARSQILAVADDLGYVGPDPAARAVAKGATGVVGVMFNIMLRNVFAEEVTTAFLGTIADGLVGSGLSLALLTTDDAGGWIPARDVPMDATLVFTSGFDAPAMGWLRKRNLPLVLVDQEPIPGVTAVTSTTTRAPDWP